MIVENLCTVIHLATALTCFWSLALLRRFLAETPAIIDEGSLERFKKMARLEMYATLLLIVIVIPSAVTAMLLSANRDLPGLSVLIVANLGLWTLGWALGKYHGHVEGQTRSLQVTEALAPEYLRVSESWVKKVLPDF